MKITDVRLYRVLAPRAATEFGYRPGSWLSRAVVANPMSVHPAYAKERASWVGPGQFPFVIEIDTDDGVTGVNANYGGGEFACAIIHGHLRRFLVGQDPFNIELLWDQMHRATLPYGLGGLLGRAIGAVDVALWDLVAKALGQPAYRILGGQTKETIPCYVTTHPDFAADWKGKGFFGVKVAAPWGVESGRDGIDRTVKLFDRLRRDLGDDMEIMIDCFMSWDLEFATRVAHAARDYGIRWFEDPLPNGWAVEQNRYLRERISPTLLALGNLEFHVKAFRDVLSHHAADVIQPEIQWVGGITATRMIAALAKAYDVPVIPHSSGAYNYHFVMANANSPYAEYVASANGYGLQPILDIHPDEPLPVDGRVRLDPTRPGFGVTVDRDRLAPWQG